MLLECSCSDGRMRRNIGRANFSKETQVYPWTSLRLREQARQSVLISGFESLRRPPCSKPLPNRLHACIDEFNRVRRETADRRAVN